MAHTFTPPKTPGIGHSFGQKSRAKVVNYGDGYEQRISTQLNHLLGSVSLQWTALTDAEAASILSDLRGWEGIQSFDYKIPGNTVTRRWVCEEFAAVEVSSKRTNVTAKFREVHDL